MLFIHQNPRVWFVCLGFMCGCLISREFSYVSYILLNFDRFCYFQVRLVGFVLTIEKHSKIKSEPPKQSQTRPYLVGHYFEKIRTVPLQSTRQMVREVQPFGFLMKAVIVSNTNYLNKVHILN